MEAYYIAHERHRQLIAFRYRADASHVLNELNQQWLTYMVEEEKVYQDAEGNPKRLFLIRATAYNESRIIQQLLSYSENVELIDPPHLRKQMCLATERMYHLYHQ